MKSDIKILVTINQLLEWYLSNIHIIFQGEATLHAFFYTGKTSTLFHKAGKAPKNAGHKQEK